ncbi:MAG: hypothetical protein IKV00_07445 [Clostridia bacterium]|nr:hypothetical protein [Clostridia bacterium]
MTNADKIRGMTDEELAKWLCIHMDCHACEADKLGNGNCREYCRGILLDWLKQEADNG